MHFFCRKVHFLYLLAVKRNKRWAGDAQQGVNLFRNGVKVFRKIVNSFRKWVNLFRNRDDLFRKAILRKYTFWEKVFSRSSLGCLSVFSRWNEARYKRGKRNGNLNKKPFFVVRSSFEVPWFFFGSSLVFYSKHIYKVQGKVILIKSIFLENIKKAN